MLFQGTATIARFVRLVTHFIPSGERTDGSSLLVTAPVYRRCAREGESLFHRTHSGRILPGSREGVNRQVFPVSQVLESGLGRSGLFDPIWLGA